MVNLNPKPYRRHAAITPLELRGAIAMLRSAQKHIVQDYAENVNENFDAWEILGHARLECVRHLETL